MSWINQYMYQFQHNFAKNDYEGNRGDIHIPSFPHFNADGRCLFLSLSTENDTKHPIGQLMNVVICEDGHYRTAPYGVTITIFTADGQSDSVTIMNGRVPNQDSKFNTKLFQGREAFLNWELKITVLFHDWSSKLHAITMNDRQISLISNNVSKCFLQAKRMFANYGDLLLNDNAGRQFGILVQLFDNYFATTDYIEFANGVRSKKYFNSSTIENMITKLLVINDYISHDPKNKTKSIISLLQMPEFKFELTELDMKLLINWVHSST